MMNVNWLAVIVAGIIPMVLGFIWYGPLFGKQWMKLTGHKEMGNKDDMPRIYGTMYVASLVMAYVLAVFISYAGASTIGAGAMVGFWAWLGFVATTMLTGLLFNKKPMNLYFIDAGYQLVTLVLEGALLAVWM